jgi:hypothetical protein
MCPRRYCSAEDVLAKYLTCRQSPPLEVTDARRRVIRENDLCATTSVVRFCPSCDSELCTSRSVRESSAEVASSNSTMGCSRNPTGTSVGFHLGFQQGHLQFNGVGRLTGSFSKQRAMATRCFSPPDSFNPRSPTCVQKLRIETIGISGERSFTRPFRDARRVPSTRL